MDAMYALLVPKLWTDTIEEHRRAVHNATLDTAAALVHEHGLASVTMSQIAAQTGIGRATLYKYFPDVEAILVAWHERQIARHLEQLVGIRDAAGGPGRQLEAVLQAYARIQHQHHDHDLAGLLHRSEHIVPARRKLHAFVSDLLARAAEAGDIRDDVAPAELASYCLSALAAASDMPSPDAVRRLVTVTLTGLRPPRAGMKDFLFRTGRGAACPSPCHFRSGCRRRRCSHGAAVSR
jgi:AcrR family transcriptional regulator